MFLRSGKSITPYKWFRYTKVRVTENGHVPQNASLENRRAAKRNHILQHNNVGLSSVMMVDGLCQVIIQYRAHQMTAHGIRFCGFTNGLEYQQ